MSEGTTKPNGSRKELEKRLEEFTDIEKVIKSAEYKFLLNALETYFSEEKVQEDGDTGTASDAKPSKAGDHTLVQNNATIAFKPLIPYIAEGAKAKLKGKDKKISKDRNSNNKESNEMRE